MKKILNVIVLVSCMNFSISSVADSVSGKITKVFAGLDNWYGVRFYMDITADNTNGNCDPSFVYTEPSEENGHNEKVSVFLAAYLAGKNVTFTVNKGRGGYCSLVEGAMY